MTRATVAVALAVLALTASLAAVVQAQRPIDKIKHIVIFMQENRAFDHYYGTLKGIRGFNDRTALTLPSGYDSFHQPINANLSEYMLPFHVSMTNTSAVCMNAPEMNYFCDIAMFNGGRYDAWNTARAAGMGMSHFNRSDLPFYYTLLDNFVVGDQYFQSTFTETNPNRLHLFTGSNGLSANQTAIINNYEPTPGFTWETMGETLEKANVSWRVYMETDNFDDNGFAWFANFQNAKAGTPLYDKGLYRSTDFVAEFRDDVQNGRLPQVSWLIAPTNQSEHATNHPVAGEDLSARLLKVLQDNPAVYAETVFIINYDEGGQFFDHHWSPTPPSSATDGVSTVTTAGEIIPILNTPLGLGFRVPLTIISPWTRGDIVVSQVFDHTSVIRFIEERFNVHCPNISPWRRVVSGDLLAAFDFDHPDYSWPQLPDTSSYVVDGNNECAHNPAPTVPAVQTFPVQEPGIRKSRALPYEFLVNDDFTSSGLVLSIQNTGAAGAAFLLNNVVDGKNFTPKKYAVESSKSIKDTIVVSAPYHLVLHGANGFIRTFAGSAIVPLSASMTYDVPSTSVVINLSNGDNVAVGFTITDFAYGYGGPWTINVAAGQTAQHVVNVAPSGQWYDFMVTVGSATSPVFSRRFMGRMEIGVDSITDPAMGKGVPSNPLLSRNNVHPLLPDEVRVMPLREGDHKDAKFYNLKTEL